MRNRIRTLYLSGKFRLADIAKQLGLHRSTVARYVASFDRHAEVAASPAATLSERDVAKLRFLAHMLDFEDIEKLHYLAHQMVCTGYCKTCGTSYLFMMWPEPPHGIPLPPWRCPRCCPYVTDNDPYRSLAIRQTPPARR
jgi:hypothetical protein